jgi:carbon storage regulator CsrA
MKMFFEGKGESIVINEDISVTALDIDGNDVTLAIDAPEGVEIDGSEPGHSKDVTEEWRPM